MPRTHDPARCEQSGATSDCTFQHAMEERNGFGSSNGNTEEPLCLQDRGGSPLPELSGDTGTRTGRRVLGTWCTRHPVCVLVLVALIVALAVAVGVLSAGRHEGDPAVPTALVLACPEDWVGYRNVCYYLSRDEGSWEWSREQCSSRGASLVVFKREWEMEFLSRVKGNIDYWLGLQRRGERLEWVDGSNFNQMIPVKGQQPCVFLNDHDLWSSSCTQSRPYVCSKPLL